MKKRYVLIPLALFLVLAVFLAIGLNRDPREVPSPLVGKPAPMFQLRQLDSEANFGPKDMAGKVWLLNVWASWCAPCREEHPLLVDYVRRGGAVPVIGLNYKDQRTAALNWLRQLGDPYAATLVDADGRIGIDYGVYGVPETFVIDRQGIVRLKHVGPLTPDVLKNKVEPVIQQLVRQSDG
jgi:cytochrome c biogenesis protein CcmG/thiol:disulfide interchange protein DsbE